MPATTRPARDDAQRDDHPWHGRRGRRGTRGFTLVEMAIASAVFVALSGVVFSLVNDASGIFHTSMQAATARRHCAEVIDSVGAELADASPFTLAIDTAPAEGDRVLLQTPLSVAAGVVTWGTKDAGGVAYADCFTSLFLEQDPAHAGLFRLVRRLVDGAGLAVGGVADEVLADGIDAPVAGVGKGFTVTRSNRLITLALRVRCLGDDSQHAGDDVVKSHQITVRLRNS